MEKLIIHKGTKDERTYTLEMDFNEVADSDVMEQFTEAMKVVVELKPEKELPVAPQDHKRKGKKEEDYSSEDMERMLVFLPAFQKLSKATRAILHSCLQLHHRDEFPSVIETGRLINEMIASDENGKREYDTMAVFTLAQDVLMSAVS